MMVRVGAVNMGMQDRCCDGHSGFECRLNIHTATIHKRLVISQRELSEGGYNRATYQLGEVHTGTQNPLQVRHPPDLDTHTIYLIQYL